MGCMAQRMTVIGQVLFLGNTGIKIRGKVQFDDKLGIIFHTSSLKTYVVGTH